MQPGFCHGLLAVCGERIACDIVQLGSLEKEVSNNCNYLADGRPRWYSASPD